MAYHVDSSSLDVEEVLTWEGFDIASRELAQQIVGPDFDPETIIAVMRSGLSLAGALSYTMGVKLSDTTNIEFYTDVAETLPDLVLLEPLLDVGSISDYRLLVVDDVAGSGCILRLVLDLLKNYGVGARSAVPYGKSHSEIAPDYVWRHAGGQIVFPRLAEPPAQKSKQLTHRRRRAKKVRRSIPFPSNINSARLVVELAQFDDFNL